MAKIYANFRSFYPFYLSQHQNKICRLLHYVGSFAVLFMLTYCLYTEQWTQLLWLPVIGYGFAWLGHFFFEKNRPATFSYPLYSFVADWVMLWDMLSKSVFRKQK